MKYSNKGPKIGYQLQFDNLSNGEKNIAGMKTWGGVKVNPKDPYLSTYLYPRDDFAKSAYTHALKRYGINSQELAPRLDANSQILLQSGSRGRYVPSEELVMLHPGMNQKTEIVKNVNHELYHHIEYCMQAQLLGDAESFPPKMRAYVRKYGRNLSSKKLELAKAYDKNWKNYIRPENDRLGYQNQIVEKHAVEKGREAVNEFNYNKNSLFSQIPYFNIM